jgi:laminin alpha 1/2
MRVGYGDTVHLEHNASVAVPLREGAWYLLRDGVKDISTRLRRTGAELAPYKGDTATRNQLLSVLADVQHVLVRAKYHTDQVEGR